MQSTAELAESRRKMQARRRMKNRIALTLSMATMAFGLFWLVWILFSTVVRGIDGMSLAFTEMTPPPNTRVVAGECPGGQRPADPVGDGLRYAAGHYGGYLPGRIRS
jgi:ABC-type phosphate transport system permease subunit